MCALALLFMALTPSAKLPGGYSFLRFAQNPLLFLAFATVGALVASRRPHNPIGWLLCAIGLSGEATSFADGYIAYGLLAGLHPLPAVEAFVWARRWVWFPSYGLLPLLLLLFPDGRLLSGRAGKP
jgi:hypothetical protein